MSQPFAGQVFVGQARVLNTEADGRPNVQILGGSCEVVICDWAIPYRYEPARGDLLMVLGKNGRYWVNGIAKAAGRSTMAFRGDTTMQAEGKLELGGDGSARFESPIIKLESSELTTDAQHIVQRVEELDNTVQGTLQERAGECERTIDETDEQLANRHSTVAKRTAKVDAEMLRLS